MSFCFSLMATSEQTQNEDSNFITFSSLPLERRRLTITWEREEGRREGRKGRRRDGGGEGREEEGRREFFVLMFDFHLQQYKSHSIPHINIHVHTCTYLYATTACKCTYRRILKLYIHVCNRFMCNN